MGCPATMPATTWRLRPRLGWGYREICWLKRPVARRLRANSLCQWRRGGLQTHMTSQTGVTRAAEDRPYADQRNVYMDKSGPVRAVFVCSVLHLEYVRLRDKDTKLGTNLFY